MARNTNFYYAFLALPREKRQAIVAVWDFCRAVDDAVDLPADEGREPPAAALDRWRAEVARVFDEHAPLTPQGRHLQPFIARFGLPRQPFDDLIAGVAMDADRIRYRDFDELAVYCYRVASTVGLICLEIFGYANTGARRYAVTLGTALQLTNILRDVGADLRRGRLYLPLEDLSRFGCTETDLARGEVTPPVRALLQHQAERARGFYRRADEQLPPEDARRLVAAVIMGDIYRALLDRIEQSGYDVLRREVRLAKPRRALVAATAFARTTWRSRRGSGRLAPGRE